MRSQPSDDPSTSQLSETAQLDELIDLLLACKNQQEFSSTVAENILSFDQKFWMRLAARNDSASSEQQRQALGSLASTVMQLVEAMVQKTESQLTDSATMLQDIMAAGANDNGEWDLPLRDDKIEAMRQAMEERGEYLDEALLSNAFAWLRKASEDGIEVAVVVLQKVLQLYAARALTRGTAASNDDAILLDILAADESRWEAMLRELAEQGELTESSLTEALQRKMEFTVLGLKSGSYAQRVQAEYLKELEDRSKAVFSDIAGVQ